MINTTKKVLSWRRKSPISVLALLRSAPPESESQSLSHGSRSAWTRRLFDGSPAMCLKRILTEVKAGQGIVSEDTESGRRRGSTGQVQTLDLEKGNEKNFLYSEGTEYIKPQSGVILEFQSPTSSTAESIPQPRMECVRYLQCRWFCNIIKDYVTKLTLLYLWWSIVRSSTEDILHTERRLEIGTVSVLDAVFQNGIAVV